MTELDATILSQANEIIQRRFRYTDQEQEIVSELRRLCVLKTYEMITSGHPIDQEAFTKKAGDESGSPGQKEESFDLAGKKIKLPSLPIIFTQVVALMGNPNSSSNDFAEVIRLDPPLAARVLKLVNSSFYGLRHRVDTVSSAVSVVGTKALYSLVLSMSVIKTFKNIPEEFVDLPSFWRHSIACGIIAKRIAENLKFSETERFFVAGLLHDIGRLIVYNYLPFRARAAFSLSFENDEPLYRSEQRVLDHDHGRFGGLLLKFWKLPDILVDMVMFHHHPLKSRHKKEVSVIHLADVITNGVRFGTSGERFVPNLDSDAWKLIETPVSYFDTLFEKIDSEVAEITRIIAPEKQ
jgi:HD-like signal output (HDOD) protein